MAIDMKALSPNERNEWEELLSKALNGSRTPDLAALDRAEAAFISADQSGREWPAIIQRQMLRDGLRNELKRLSKSEAITQVDYQGNLVGKTMRRGTKHKRADGSVGFQQTLISDMTWEQFDSWLAMNASQIAGLLVNKAIGQKLLALREISPASTGPGDACHAIGTTVADYLAAAESA